MCAHIDRRNDVWADRRRGQVNDPLSIGDQHFAVARMRLSRGCVEDNSDFIVVRHFAQSVYAFRRNGNAKFLGTLQPIGLRIYSYESAELKQALSPHQFDHQIGAYISAADDGDLDG